MKGWLATVGPGKPPRLTEGQKALALKTIGHTLQHAINGDDMYVKLFGGFIADVVKRVVDEYPADRSCHTCDYEQAGCCANNDHAQIPVPFLNEGCDDWKDQGSPF